MNEQQAFRAIRNTIRLEHLSDDLANTVGPELREVFRELGEQFKAMPPGNIEREIWYRQARQRIASVFVPLNNEMRDELMQRLDSEVVDQMKFAESYLNDAAGDAAERAAVVAPQGGVSVLEGTSKVQFTRQQLHTIAESTTVLGDRLGDLFRPSLDKGGKWGKWIEQNIGLIDRKVKTGFLTGMTSDQIAATLPGLGREAVRRNKAIARTAVMDMSARSQEALWQANSDVIKGWEFDATMDNRVCDECAPWDGEFKQTRGQLPTTPLHINCRCRVLPLSASEMLLRKEDGPQRRSVVELIDAPSKEAAIAKAKLKPGVKAARAYASQVKGPDGRKYWRVAEDIVKSDKPLTMAEFLKQASPATQQQVLGSEKRRSEFLKLIRGTGGRPPISPDRALKEVTEWRPTVTRRPRLSAQMKLDISKLKSQKELMKQQVGSGKHGVYAFLDENGKPRYIGQMSRASRPWEPHTASIPSNPAQVRLIKGNLTQTQANKLEKSLISRYGRQKLDASGVSGRPPMLENIAPGGKTAGSKGYRHTAEARKRIAAGNSLAKQSARLRSAQALGMPLDQYEALSLKEKTAVKAWVARNPGKSGIDYFSQKAQGLLKAGGKAGKVTKSVREAAARFGIPADKYAQLSQKERHSVRGRWDRGIRGQKELLRGFLDSADTLPKRTIEAAQKLGLDPATYVKLSANQKALIRYRHKQGLRGAALLEGL